MFKKESVHATIRALSYIDKKPQYLGWCEIQSKVIRTASNSEQSCRDVPFTRRPYRRDYAKEVPIGFA